MPEVANCKRCNKIFQKVYSPMCPECYLEYMQTFSEVYRYVQENPDMTLEEISAQCSVPLKDMEAIFYDGKLGTAASNVVYNCLRCSTAMKPIHRRGRFCVRCTEKIETEAGLDVKREEAKSKKLPGYGYGDVIADKKPGKTAASGQTLDERLEEKFTKPKAKPTPGKDDDGSGYGFKRFS